MNTYIALFRGINVGGKHALPMKELKAALEKSGCVGVRTYIQSGNVILSNATSDAGRLERQIGALVSKSHGFEPRVLVLTLGEFERAVVSNPFPEATDNPGSFHVFFLAGVPETADLKAIEALKAKTERFALKGRMFYLYTPRGFGTSKLAARVERLLGVEATARNWRTVTTLLEMVKPKRT